MKYKQRLINLIVILALLGFISTSLLLFYKSFSLLGTDKQLPSDYLSQINTSLVYVTSCLTGLVGSIVATAFGVKTPSRGSSSPTTLQNYNFQSLGRMISASPKMPVEDGKGFYGFLYALSYIIIGVIAIIIWMILGNNTIPGVTNMATTFLGMMIPIVASYFNHQN